MKKFEVKKFTAEIKEKNNIKTGCCLSDPEPESIAIFEAREEAMSFLSQKQYEPSISKLSTVTGDFYKIEEFAVEIYEADEDGELISGSDYDSYFKFVFDYENDDIKIVNG